MQAPTAILPPVPLAGNDTLPPAQYDVRNIEGVRFIEVGETFNLLPAANDPVKHITVSVSDVIGLFSFDPSVTFRTLTVGLESYSVRHFIDAPAATPPPTSFEEKYREPIAVVCPQLQVFTQSRYFCMLPNDAGQGLAGAVSVSFASEPFPPQLDFYIGLLNPIPSDSTLYNVNVRRTVEPIWESQFIRSLTVRLYFKAQYEPNRIPVVGLFNQNIARGNGAGMIGHGGPGTGGAPGGGGGQSSARDPLFALSVLEAQYKDAAAVVNSVVSHSQFQAQSDTFKSEALDLVGQQTQAEDILRDSRIYRMSGGEVPTALSASVSHITQHLGQDQMQAFMDRLHEEHLESVKHWITRARTLPAFIRTGAAAAVATAGDAAGAGVPPAAAEPVVEEVEMETDGGAGAAAPALPPIPKPPRVSLPAPPWTGAGRPTKRQIDMYRESLTQPQRAWYDWKKEEDKRKRGQK